jgi:hypothetical protein
MLSVTQVSIDKACCCIAVVSQPRTLLASCQLLLCGPERTNTLPHQAGLIEHASPSLNILSSSHKEGGVMVARALLGVASLLQGLHGEAAQVRGASGWH